MLKLRKPIVSRKSAVGTLCCWRDRGAAVTAWPLLPRSGPRGRCGAGHTRPPGSHPHSLLLHRAAPSIVLHSEHWYYVDTTPGLALVLLRGNKLVFNVFEELPPCCSDNAFYDAQ